MKKVDKVVIFIIVSMLCFTTSVVYYQICQHFGVTMTVKDIVAINFLATIPFLIYPACVITLIWSLFDGTFVEYTPQAVFVLINHFIMYKLYCISFKEEFKQFSKMGNTRIPPDPEK